MIIVTMFFILCMISLLFVYIMRKNNIWDQIIGMNVITNMVVLLILLLTLYRNSSIYVDAAIIYALLSFIGSLFIVVYVYRRGDV